MKKVTSIFAMAAVVLSLGLSSCAKEDPASALEVNMERTATVTGYFLMVTDTKPDSKGLTYYSSPSAENGKKITATIAYSDLLGGEQTGVYTVAAEKITYDESTGQFSIVVPVAASGSDVTISLSSFAGKQSQQTVADPTKYEDVNGTWSIGSHTASKVMPGDNKFIDANGIWGKLAFTKTTKKGDTTVN